MLERSEVVFGYLTLVYLSPCLKSKHTSWFPGLVKLFLNEPAPPAPPVERLQLGLLYGPNMVKSSEYWSDKDYVVILHDSINKIGKLSRAKYLGTRNVFEEGQVTKTMGANNIKFRKAIPPPIHNIESVYRNFSSLH